MISPEVRLPTTPADKSVPTTAQSTLPGQKRPYKHLLFEERRELIFAVERGGKTIREAARILGIKYSTAKTVMMNYRTTGHVETQLTRKRKAMYRRLMSSKATEDETPESKSDPQEQNFAKSGKPITPVEDPLPSTGCDPRLWPLAPYTIYAPVAPTGYCLCNCGEGPLKSEQNFPLHQGVEERFSQGVKGVGYEGVPND